MFSSRENFDVELYFVRNTLLFRGAFVVQL